MGEGAWMIKKLREEKWTWELLGRWARVDKKKKREEKWTWELFRVMKLSDKKDNKLLTKYCHLYVTSFRSLKKTLLKQ